MKKYFVVSLVAAGVLLSACGAGIGGQTNTVTVTATPTAVPQPIPVPTEPTVADKEYMFLETMRNSGITWLMAADTNQLLDLAYQTCQILDSGYTVDELIQGLAENFVNDGLTNDPELYEGTGILIGASVAIFCPQYGYEFNA